MTNTSTPYKRGVTGFADTTRCKSMEPFLKEDLDRKFSSSVSFREFVHHVWGIDYDIAYHLLTLLKPNDCAFPTEALQRYESASKETKMYTPFTVIAQNLVEQAAKAVELLGPDKVKANRVKFWHGKGRQQFASVLWDVKPDLLTVAKELFATVGSVHTWGHACHIIEAKHKDYTWKEKTQRKKHKPSGGLRPSNDSKRRHTGHRMAADTIQIARYGLECMAASTRHYASGTGLIDSRFPCEHPEQLAVVLYALSVCDDVDAGVDPHLVYPSTRPERPKNALKHWQDVVGATINLPSSNDSPDQSFLIEETIFRYRGLVGRGTMVYRVSSLLNLSLGSLALKLGFPVTDHVLEAKTISHLRDTVPAWCKDHLPEVTFSTSRTAEQLSLHRVELLKLHPIVAIEDRLLHALVMKLYGKLWTVGRVEAFMDVYVDCVECHFHSYSAGNVLHRDLSENDIMFNRLDNGDIKGILNDWDMSSWLDEDTKAALPSTATQLTGTLPFMARDLLVDGNSPPHLYRHDLEYFLYILIWAAFHYDFDQQTQAPKIHSALARWDNSDLENCCNAKIVLITDSERRDVLFASVPPAGQHLLP
ncbi:hypothetical protein DXG03_009439 [Asterophora parasitica]|uniref:Fungal-type protein kinase domain-containing protein n=1 Tax=Asterophora parasitica TaxID=117018 RepID=A0A9P7GI90_9AGAR|nr:hypothetical protein DXG03_009439 [Asterophora parasitica]